MSTRHLLSKKFSNLFPAPRFMRMPAAGVDISDEAVKYMDLRKTPAGKVPVRYGEFPIPKGVVVGGNIEEPEALAKVLLQLKKETGITAVRASLPEEKAYLFQLEVDAATSYDQLRGTIEFKLEENVPISAQEALFDFDIVELGKEQQGATTVVVAVYPKAVVESYLSAFVMAGLDSYAFTIEAQAIADAVIREGDCNTYSIIDFGRTRTGLSIVTHNVLSFTSTLEVQGETVTQSIKKLFNATDAEAERIKNEEGLLQLTTKPELHSLLDSTVSHLKNEINKYHEFWYSKQSSGGGEYQKIEKIIVCGGNANLAGLSQYLSLHLKLPVEMANVWQNAFSFEEYIPEIDARHSLSYATAIGLALCGV